MALSYERRHAGLLGLHKRPSGEFSFVGLVRSIEVNTSEEKNSGAGLDPLHNYSLPANSLRSDGDYLHGIAGGNFAANANNKRIRFSVGGTGVIDTGSINMPAAIGWRLNYTIVRLSATSVLVNADLVSNTLSVNAAAVVNTNGNAFHAEASTISSLAVSDLASNTLQILVEAEGTASDDIIQNLTIIELVQN